MARAEQGVNTAEKFRQFFSRRLTRWERFRSLLRNIAEYDIINVGLRDLLDTEIPGIKYRDITPEIIRLIDRRNIQDGILNIQTKHTTTGLALLVQENESGLLQNDLVKRYICEKLRPEWERLRRYEFEHDREERIVALGGSEPRNGLSHALAADRDLCQPSILWNVHRGALDLGTWQSVLLFVDFDSGPHHPGRQISIVVQRVLPTPRKRDAFA